MDSDPNFLRVQGPNIVNGLGEAVRLRGFCLGGWLNMENFMTGFPGHESGMRAAVAHVLGEAKAGFFFERFLHYFIAEDDLSFIKSLGCNLVRLPFNYRHFESDERPFEYKLEGFAQLDKVIGWARTLQLYVILDLHAAQGWQNPGWHSDNAAGKALFWGQKTFEDRAVALWEEIGRRYCEEPYVAGYNVMNEPHAGDVKQLNHFYYRVTQAIRAVDPNHILFLEGNHDSQQFDELDVPFDGNTVYSSHNYVVPGLDAGEYPGEFGGEFYDRTRLEQGYRARTAYMRRYGVPHYFGEFGCLFNEGVSEASRLRVLTDLIDIAEAQGDHWTLWAFKDIGKMGLVYVHPESEWMRRTCPIRALKTALRCDHWIERHTAPLDQFIEQIAEHVTQVGAGWLGNEAENLAESLRWAICGGTLSQALLRPFAEQFRRMGENEIDHMMQSFALRNCMRREGWIELVSAMRESADQGLP